MAHIILAYNHYNIYLPVGESKALEYERLVCGSVNVLGICKLDSGGGAELEHCPHRTVPLRP